MINIYIIINIYKLNKDFHFLIYIYIYWIFNLFTNYLLIKI